ncbi:MAG: hypothetical protein AB7P04_13705 [Bacteriovoracia bacterium]
MKRWWLVVLFFCISGCSGLKKNEGAQVRGSFPAHGPALSPRTDDLSLAPNVTRIHPSAFANHLISLGGRSGSDGVANRIAAGRPTQFLYGGSNYAAEVNEDRGFTIAHTKLLSALIRDFCLEIATGPGNPRILFPDADPARVDARHLFLTAISRYPTEEETEALEARLQAATQKRVTACMFVLGSLEAMTVH